MTDDSLPQPDYPPDFDPSMVPAVLAGEGRAVGRVHRGFREWSDAQRALVVLALLLGLVMIVALAALAGDGRQSAPPPECDDDVAGLFGDC